MSSSELQTIVGPSKPARRAPRVERLLLGGFIITAEEGIKWANRLRASQPGKRPIELCGRDEGRLLITLDQRVKELGGIEVDLYGERDPEPDECYDYLIIVTQYSAGRFKCVKGKPQMEPSQKLVPGEFEEYAKELLKQEGITHSEFETIFG